MCLLLDYENSKIHIDFGSFPVFEIAVERVLTEVYQGIINLNNIHYTLYPSRNLSIKEKIFNPLNCLNLYPSIDEKILLNKKEKCEPNKNIFLFKDDKNYNNIDILNYYK